MPTSSKDVLSIAEESRPPSSSRFILNYIKKLPAFAFRRLYAFTNQGDAYIIHAELDVSQ